MNRVIFVFQFLPLSIFAMIARSRGFDDQAWSVAFQAGGAIAAVETVLLTALRKPLSRLLLGANAFLALGGMGFWLELSPVLSLCGAMREAALFACVIAVGVVTTLLSERGFIGSDSTDRASVRRASWVLLAVAAVGLGMSLMFSGNILLAGMLPFVLLLLTRRRLLTRLAVQGPERLGGMVLMCGLLSMASLDSADAAVPGPRIVGRPGNLVAVDVPAKGREWRRLGEWPIAQGDRTGDNSL